MKIGPLEVVWHTKQTIPDTIRQEVGRLIERDEHVRWAIARCARSVTKDYLADLAEAADQEVGLLVSGPITCEDMGHDPRIHSPSGRAEMERERLAAEYEPDVPPDHLAQSRLADECDDEAEQRLADQGDQFTHVPKGTPS